MNIDPDQVAAVARALDADPRNVRADTPLSLLGWTGSAGEWAVVSDHLGCAIAHDPSAEADVATIGELVAIVITIHQRSLTGGTSTVVSSGEKG